MSRKQGIALFIVAGAVAAASAGWMLQRNHAANGAIRVSGNIEVTEAEVSFKIPGRVEVRLVNEGERVAAGRTVARLDSADLAQQVAIRRADVQAAEAFLQELEAGSRPEEIAQAEAAAQAARATLDELLAGSRSQEIGAADSEVAWARAEVDRLDADLKRYTRLRDQRVISTQAYDAARTAYEVAAARLRGIEERYGLVKEGPRRERIDQARAALRQAEERYALVLAGPRKETIEQARARLRQAKEALTAAEIQLGYATLISPLSGLVLSDNVENGEFVSPGMPVVTVGDLDHPWLRAYINETDLGRVKIGQPLEVSTDTYPDKVYAGVVTFIGSQAEFTPKSVQTEKERVKLVYRIKVEIENPNMELKPGMPAAGVIRVTWP